MLYNKFYGSKGVFIRSTFLCLFTQRVYSIFRQSSLIENSTGPQPQSSVTGVLSIICIQVH